MARIENVDSKIIKGVAGGCIIIGFWVDIPIAYYHISADQHWISSLEFCINFHGNSLPGSRDNC